eukprot:Skav230573  [mRNA]  locus=scaffold971:152920:156087:- [translate_table: standard]
MAEAKGWQVQVWEVDIRRDDTHDLTDVGFQEIVLKHLSKGKFHVVLCTPPCSTWSRVRAANLRGPPPLRSKDYPWGFPWLSKRLARDADLGSTLVKFSLQVWGILKLCPQSWDGLPVFMFGEHPEDLGLVVREEDGLHFQPASIWQLPQLRALVDDVDYPLMTVAINQCCWGAGWRKPTRLLTSSEEVASWGPQGWPVFDKMGRYEGPLQRDCTCQLSKSLVKRSNDEGFQTTGTDAYPAALDQAIAEAAVRHVESHLLASSKEGVAEAASEEKDVTQGEEGRKHVGGAQEPMLQDEEEEVQGHDGEWQDPTVQSQRAGWGRPIRCYYKGRFRTIHDGGGLCSPGRWPVEQRKPLVKEGAIMIASCCKQEFLKWIKDQEQKEDKGVKEIFWSLATGKLQESPFDRCIEESRRKVDEALKSLGKYPDRREGDRVSEVNFRRLAAMLDVVEDEDWEWLQEAVSEGVSLGVDETMPRVPQVFEEKVKWSLDFTEEVFRDSEADNYRSAEENSADIRRQVMEEVQAGFIKQMRLEEAKEDFKGRLAIAALGAVPKELGSSVVRIVHDGSYSVDVNHRIKVLDRMRFPMIDDASGILLEIERSSVEEGKGARCSLLYDISKAHKLLPVKKRDWGYQAFKLPGKDMEDQVFLHTRGTFGIASAAYHWQRLAACVVRLNHRLCGIELGVLHLLFADDGWLTAVGSFFWRKLLFWLFCLEILEVPISWKKVRGGAEVQWIGYQLDVGGFRKGISTRKVRWVMDWMERHLSAGGITGRDLKSALGRFGFVAGALPHVRPFLGPLFAWAAMLAPGTFARFPDAVRILLQFVQQQIRDEPMSRPKKIKEFAREAFRVDAKAEQDKIVIGGWEVGEGGSTKDSRWFSIHLDRKSAPWAYLKGEPYRNIASLELVAVLTAVMLFGLEGEEAGCMKTLTLSASTDNLGNTYVLRHFMSCKYPLSIVVMELAVQLKRRGIELNLGWIPRGQNCEADALTNEEFEGFNPNKRIHKKFEELDFLVLDELMGKAGELDQDMKLAKSSREAKGDRPSKDTNKRKRGETKWKDPW